MHLSARTSLALTLAASAWLLASQAHAGPPFVTDDPEPVEYQHWELYFATQQFHSADGWSGTIPQIELNYGVLPEVQLHVIAPMQYVKAPTEPFHYGYGDTELGVKYRFLNIGEEKDAFMVGIFPLVEVPTGSTSRGLGNGIAQEYIPIWLQKNFDQWSTYGGGGWWHNPGNGNHDFWQLGWQVQRKITEKFSAGIEILYQSKDTVDLATVAQHPQWDLNAGIIWDLSDKYHILCSAGHSVGRGNGEFQGYLALQITWGPEKEKEKEKESEKSGK